MRDKDNILVAPSVKEAKKRILSAIDRALDQICKRRKIVDGKIASAGDWFRTVKAACRATNFNIAKTPFGKYDYRAFLHPTRQQLGALLRVQARALMQEFLDRCKNQDEPATPPEAALDIPAHEGSQGGASPKDAAWQGTQGQPPLTNTPGRTVGEIKQFPKRAKWLDERLIERGWNVSTFDQNNDGPSRKTVSLITYGKRVSRRSLVKLARALSTNTEFPPVMFKDIPNE